MTIVALAWNQRLAPSRAGFRATSASLHAATVLVTAVWLVWTFRRLGGFPDGRARAAAWIGASLFAVHPLGSEAVFWAVGRAEILAAGCGLVAFLCWVSPGGTGLRWAGAAAFFLALGSKESAATVSLLAAAAWWLWPREGRPEAKDAWRRTVPLSLAGERGGGSDR